MTVIKSSAITETSQSPITESLPYFEFVFNENGSTKKVTDKDLNSEMAAKMFATKEFLLNSYDVQSVTFSSYAQGLNINDIISVSFPEYKIPIDLTKTRFIVRELTTQYEGAKAMDNIKAVRYDDD